MSNMSCDLKTQYLAKRHGNSSNQKCNFKYLMNTKTSRCFKYPLHTKENQIQSLLLNSVHKFALKTVASHKPDSQEYQQLSVPLSVIEGNFTSRQSCKKQPNFNKPQPQNVWSEIYSNLNSTANLKVDVNNCQVNTEQKIYTDVSQISSVEAACMTDECYYEKQLQIKMQLVQKERDQIWNSIADIVKENMALKDIIAGFTIDAKTSTNISVQTQRHQTVSFSSQTEVSMTDLQNMEIISINIQEQLNQAREKCFKIIPEQVGYDQSLQVELKDLILQTVNLNILNVSRQFEKQKEFLIKLSNQQIQKHKDHNDKLSIQMNNIKSKLQQSVKMKDNIKKIYQKQIQDMKNSLQKKQINFINSVIQMKQEWEHVLNNYEQQSKYYLQYFQNTKKCLNQKQTLYSTLLSQSHKTIHNLMIQMKQFQSLANSNYYKHLKSQRSQKQLRFQYENFS